MPFLKFYALNVVDSLSDLIPNGKAFNIHKSSVNRKDPQNISQEILTNPYKPKAYIGDFTVSSKSCLD